MFKSRNWAVAGLLCLCQTGFAITIINQTDSVKTVEIEEAYRPAPDKPGDLAAPKSLGHAPQVIDIPPHSMQTISLRAPCGVLVLGIIEVKREKNKTSTLKIRNCYEPYAFQNQPEEFINDDWGFVIHKPVAESAPTLDFFAKRAVEKEKEQGYGIKCLHPQLLAKTTLEELPADLSSYNAGEAPISRRITR